MMRSPLPKGFLCSALGLLSSPLPRNWRTVPRDVHLDREPEPKPPLLGYTGTNPKIAAANKEIPNFNPNDLPVFTRDGLGGQYLRTVGMSGTLTTHRGITVAATRETAPLPSTEFIEQVETAPMVSVISLVATQLSSIGSDIRLLLCVLRRWSAEVYPLFLSDTVSLFAQCAVAVRCHLDDYLADPSSYSQTDLLGTAISLLADISCRLMPKYALSLQALGETSASLAVPFLTANPPASPSTVVGLVTALCGVPPGGQPIQHNFYPRTALAAATGALFGRPGCEPVYRSVMSAMEASHPWSIALEWTPKALRSVGLTMAEAAAVLAGLAGADASNPEFDAVPPVMLLEGCIAIIDHGMGVIVDEIETLGVPMNFGGVLAACGTSIAALDRMNHRHTQQMVRNFVSLLKLVAFPESFYHLESPAEVAIGVALASRVLSDASCDVDSAPASLVDLETDLEFLRTVVATVIRSNEGALSSLRPFWKYAAIVEALAPGRNKYHDILAVVEREINQVFLVHQVSLLVGMTEIPGATPGHARTEKRNKRTESKARTALMNVMQDDHFGTAASMQDSIYPAYQVLERYGVSALCRVAVAFTEAGFLDGIYFFSVLRFAFKSWDFQLAISPNLLVAVAKSMLEMHDGVKKISNTHLFFQWMLPVVVYRMDSFPTSCLIKLISVFADAIVADPPIFDVEIRWRRERLILWNLENKTKTLTKNGHAWKASDDPMGLGLPEDQQDSNAWKYRLDDHIHGYNRRAMGVHATSTLMPLRHAPELWRSFEWQILWRRSWVTGKAIHPRGLVPTSPDPPDTAFSIGDAISGTRSMAVCGHMNYECCRELADIFISRVHAHRYRLVKSSRAALARALVDASPPNTSTRGPSTTSVSNACESANPTTDSSSTSACVLGDEVEDGIEFGRGISPVSLLSRRLTSVASQLKSESSRNTVEVHTAETEDMKYRAVRGVSLCGIEHVGMPRSSGFSAIFPQGKDNVTAFCDPSTGELKLLPPVEQTATNNAACGASRTSTVSSSMAARLDVLAVLGCPNAARTRSLLHDPEYNEATAFDLPRPDRTPGTLLAHGRSAIPYYSPAHVAADAVRSDRPPVSWYSNPNPDPRVPAEFSIAPPQRPSTWQEVQDLAVSRAARSPPPAIPVQLRGFESTPALAIMEKVSLDSALGMPLTASVEALSGVNGVHAGETADRLTAGNQLTLAAGEDTGLSRDEVAHASRPGALSQTSSSISASALVSSAKGGSSSWKALRHVLAPLAAHGRSRLLPLAAPRRFQPIWKAELQPPHLLGPASSTTRGMLAPRSETHVSLKSDSNIDTESSVDGVLPSGSQRRNAAKLAAFRRWAWAYLRSRAPEVLGHSPLSREEITDEWQKGISKPPPLPKTSRSTRKAIRRLQNAIRESRASRAKAAVSSVFDVEHGVVVETDTDALNEEVDYARRIRRAAQLLRATVRAARPRSPPSISLLAKRMLKPRKTDGGSKAEWNKLLSEEASSPPSRRDLTSVHDDRFWHSRRGQLPKRKPLKPLSETLLLDYLEALWESSMGDDDVLSLLMDELQPMLPKLSTAQLATVIYVFPSFAFIDDEFMTAATNVILDRLHSTESMPSGPLAPNAARPDADPLQLTPREIGMLTVGLSIYRRIRVVPAAAAVASVWGKGNIRRVIRGRTDSPAATSDPWPHSALPFGSLPPLDAVPCPGSVEKLLVELFTCATTIGRFGISQETLSEVYFSYLLCTVGSLPTLAVPKISPELLEVWMLAHRSTFETVQRAHADILGYFQSSVVTRTTSWSDLTVCGHTSACGLSVTFAVQQGRRVALEVLGRDDVLLAPVNSAALKLTGMALARQLFLEDVGWGCVEVPHQLWPRDAVREKEVIIGRWVGRRKQFSLETLKHGTALHRYPLKDPSPFENATSTTRPPSTLPPPSHRPKSRTTSPRSWIETPEGQQWANKLYSGVL